MANPAQRPIRHYQLPPTLTGKLWVWRYLIARRVVQFGVLALFFGTVHYGWSVFGQPLLTGNLSASEIVGLVPMADPFASAQILLSRHLLIPEVLIGALITLGFYALVGGRVFCSWVCPVNPVTDLANWVRGRLGIKDVQHVSRRLRYGVLALALLLSLLTGVAAFEWVSPIAMTHREVIYGVGLGWAVLLGIFLFDLLILRHGWCGHVCPLGAFYALVGKVAQVRVRFDEHTCTHCGDCARVCPEPHVLDLKKAAEAGYVAFGECTNCGRCTPVCPEGSLSFDWRPLIAEHNRQAHT
jgi:ferredoxin-type protein NapH